jgi:hypothetical protein
MHTPWYVATTIETQGRRALPTGYARAVLGERRQREHHCRTAEAEGGIVLVTRTHYCT